MAASLLATPRSACVVWLAACAACVAAGALGYFWLAGERRTGRGGAWLFGSEPPSQPTNLLALLGSLDRTPGWLAGCLLARSHRQPATHVTPSYYSKQATRPPHNSQAAKECYVKVDIKLATLSRWHDHSTTSPTTVFLAGYCFRYDGAVQSNCISFTAWAVLLLLRLERQQHFRLIT